MRSFSYTLRQNKACSRNDTRWKKNAEWRAVSAVYMGSVPTINKKELTNRGTGSMRNLELEHLLAVCQKGQPELRGGWLSRNRNRVLQEVLPR